MRWTPRDPPSGHDQGFRPLVYGLDIPRRGANTTKASRIGMNIGYSLGWLRQEENQYLACPPEIARTLPRGCSG